MPDSQNQNRPLIQVRELSQDVLEGRADGAIFHARTRQRDGSTMLEVVEVTTGDEVFFGAICVPFEQAVIRVIHGYASRSAQA